MTNLPGAIPDFYEQCHGRVIYKSLSAARSIVVRMTDADLGRLDQVRRCVTQFQEWIPGDDIRVHVVGKWVFPTEIRTSSVDYRYAYQEGNTRMLRAVELPPEIARKCVALAERLGLVVAGVDLRRSLDGQYYCFEANPTPGFSFYERRTGQGICDGLIDLLARGKVA